MAKRTAKTAKRKRGYSREFTARGKGKEYKMDGIPPALWDRVRRKARRDGVSLRALILTHLRNWVETPDVLPPTPPPPSSRPTTAQDGHA